MPFFVCNGQKFRITSKIIIIVRSSKFDKIFMKRLTDKKGEVKAREKVYGDDTYFVV